MPLIMTLQLKRPLKTIAAIICLFILSWWLLDHIRSIGGVQTVGVPSPDVEEDDGLVGKDRAQQVEELAERRERLEQGRQDERNRVERLKQFLAAIPPKLDELRVVENTLDNAWNTLESAGHDGARSTESMAQDYRTLRRQRESVVMNASALSERYTMLDAILRQIGGEDIGTALETLAPLVNTLEGDVQGLAQTHRETARQVERLTERARSGSSRGRTLSDAVAHVESVEVAPELGASCVEHEAESVAECDRYLQGLVERTKREAEDLASRQRSSSSAEAQVIRSGTADLLAAHKAEQERLDRDVESKQAAVAFERDRAKIEHYLVPFIALKRTYTTPAVMGDEIKEFAWAEIPLEQAASFSQIEESGAFQSGGTSYQRLESFTQRRLRQLDSRYLPFGQHWSYDSTNYLILARELLLNHGPTMVEKGLLQP